MNHLFDELRLMEVEFAMRVSYLELYNEELCDLLSSDDTAKIRIYDDVAKKGSVIVQGLEEIPVKCKSDVYRLLSKGQERRRTAATLMNAQSSRSHTIFTILVHIKENNVDGEEMLKIGKLNLVDLAGSENISKAGNEKGIRTRESVNINQSLLTLGRVITALVERTPHIPYRESKLTRLLQESLGGRTKTSIIATVSPGHKDLEETLSTLDYAHRAKNIQNKPEINQRLTKKVVLKEYTEEIDRLKRDLMAAREKNGIYLASDTYNEMIYKMEKDQKELNENIARCRGLKEELQEKTKLFEDCSQNLEFVSDELDKEKSKNQITEYELKRTKRNLRKTEKKNLEKTQIIKTQQTTEMLLTEHAKQLMCVVDEAASDTTSLIESIDRRKAVEEKAISESDQLMKNLNSNIEIMRQELKELGINHKESVKIAITDLEENTQCNREFVSTVGEALKELKDLRNSNGTTIVEIFGNFQKQFSESSQSNVESLTKLRKNLEDQQEIFFNTINEKIQTIESVLSMEKQENEKNHSQMNEKFENHNQLIEKFCSDVKSKIDQFSSEFMKISNNLKLKTETQKDKLKEIMKLLKEVDEINEECHSMPSQVDQVNTNLKSIETTLMNEFEENHKKIVEDETNSLKSIQNYRMKTVDQISENIQLVSEITKSNNNELKMSLDQQAKSISNNNDQLHENLTKMRDVLQDNQKKTQDEDNKKIDKLADNFKTENNRSVGKSQEVKSIVQQTLSGLVSKANEKIGNSLEKCSESIQEFEDQDVLHYKSTGQTPARKEYKFNRNIVATSPHERIIKRFRVESGMLDTSLDSSIIEGNEVIISKL